MAKKKTSSKQDPAALADEVSDLEVLVRRRKKLKAELAALEDDIEEPEGAEPVLPGSELVDQVLSTLNGEGSFSITKLEGVEPIDCGTYDLTLWPDAMKGVISKFGGGSYVLVFHRADGTIAKRIKRTYPGPTPQAQSPAAQGSSDLLSMLRIMEERESRRDAQTEALRLEAMKSQQAMMTALIGVMGTQNKPLINNATELATIAKLFGDKKSGLEDLLALKDLLEDLKGDPEQAGIHVQTDNPIVAALAPLLGSLGKALGSVAPAANPPARAVLPAAAPPSTERAPAAPRAPSPAPTPAPSPAGEAQGLLSHVAMLKTAIDAGTTPVIAAETAWASARENSQVPDLIALIERGNWEELKAHEDLKAHAGWLDAFRAELRARIPTPEPAPEPPADGGADEAAAEVEGEEVTS